ncbi:PSD1 and planctomycete cytochrome C domain-containing protein [uncultured Gimesia sp.]|uniref:PSD1 and planctomycete cytochrome C domain-containing protein n=1 Tax=uncultured Gimesia sp. TaxID=1678688 RepID=UPI0030D9805B|tara:strand:- start:165018 stop:168161 length:3144 start_codon:yes stop_codon:yes gene_type:complete
MRSRSLLIWLPVVVLGATFISVFAAEDSKPQTALAEAKVDFSRDIRPILSNNCFFCHGPDEKHREGDLRLDTKVGAFESAIVPGNLKESALIERILATDADERMPPADSGKTLKPAEIELLKQWVQQGADWQDHWAYVKPEQAALPKVKQIDWPRNEIDYFVLSRLEKAGLTPSKAADRRTLIRRLYLDLQGLPPSATEVDAFVNSKDPKAYEKLVDHLLASPQYAERMTLKWLDLARYADTNGYSIDGGRHMWLWRDWVINSFHKNQPFNQFITEQIAGDLIPEATPWQKVATGFSRNHMITHEGGTIPEENLLNYTVDRVKTTSEVFMGLTMACAQCHDHKYDPITMKDFYQFIAYFNTLEDRGLDGNSGVNAGPKLSVKTELSFAAAELKSLDQELARLQNELAHPDESKRAAWEAQAQRELAERGEGLKLHELEIVKVSDPNTRTAFETSADGHILALTASGRSPSISLKVKPGVEQLTGLRIVFYPNEKLPEGGIGHGKKESFPGGFILTSFATSGTAIHSDQLDLYAMFNIARITASNSHADYPVIDCLDPRDHNGWSPAPQNQKQQHLTVTFDKPYATKNSPYVTVMLVWGGGKFGGRQALMAGDYQVLGISGVDDGTNIPDDIQKILAVDPTKRDAKQIAALKTYYSQIAPEFENLRYQLTNLKERQQMLTSSFETMVMNTAKKPRETFILNRGQYDQPTEKVSTGVPGFLPELPGKAPANRMALAQWLTSRENPLVTRVAVNRFWEMLFGQGIVSTTADFGSQGDPPSHPKLLDWLSVDFYESGWDVKRIMKKILMSATYQQASAGTPELWKQDPQNRLLARGGRFRLQAEAIRDATLKVSGLLVERVGGASVNPYQPEGLWREVSHYGSSPATAQVFVQDHGEKLYRRSMYTYWKRTVPPPNMQTFDAPNREVCLVSRARTNTPLQSLVLLNDVQFVEASRNYAERIMKEGGTEIDSRIQFAFKEAQGRLPEAWEVKTAKAAYLRELKNYQSNESAALALLSQGESNRDEGLPPAEVAAWTAVASMIFNTYEFITRG